MRLKFFSLVLCLCFGVVFAEQSVITDVHLNSSSGMTKNPAKMGGWYPVFFDKYSDEQVNQIITSIRAGRVQKIVISYDENLSLATKIKHKLYLATNFPIELKEEKQHDGTAKYNHKRVVATIWSK